ncbi:MAG: hypothetical protein IH921_08360, partial [Gemmatimonadetes bacterium]|nr:hypothetical protein [Gemmatimonadota bacterium]
MTPQTRTSLKELQNLDQEIAAVRSATESFDPLLEEVDAPVLRLEQEVQALEKRLTEIRLEENRLELTIEERQVRLAKLKERMEAVRNVREEAAVHAELEMVRRLFMGHRWRWGEDELEVVATEQQFCIPLRNPKTGHPTQNFWLAGKIDRIVKLPEGPLAIQEYKTTGRSLGLDGELWQRLRFDQQIGIYFLAAKTLGHPVTEILYDVTRKPTLKPREIP